MHWGLSNICKDKVNIGKELLHKIHQIHDAERVIY